MKDLEDMATSKFFQNSSRTSTRKGQAHEDNQVEVKASSTPITKPDRLDKLFTEISKMNDTLQGVATDVLSIKQTTAELNNTVTTMQERLGEAEARISHLEERSEQLMNDKGGKDKQMEQLWNRVQALENHSRRNNVRLVGLKETFGTNGTLLDCVRKILAEGLGIEPEGDLEIERVHRQLAPMPNTDQPPRSVLIRFLRQSARDKVISAAKEKRGFIWGGCRLSVFPDMSRELALKRKAFTTVKRKLHELDVRYTLAFPATLHFKWRGKNMSCNTVEAAEKIITELSPG